MYRNGVDAVSFSSEISYKLVIRAHITVVHTSSSKQNSFSLNIAIRTITIYIVVHEITDLSPHQMWLVLEMKCAQRTSHPMRLRVNRGQFIRFGSFMWAIPGSPHNSRGRWCFRSFQQVNALIVMKHTRTGIADLVVASEIAAGGTHFCWPHSVGAQSAFQLWLSSPRRTSDSGDSVASGVCLPS